MTSVTDRFVIDDCEHITVNLLEILSSFDHVDPIQREKTQSVIEFVLQQHVYDERILELSIRLLEKIVPINSQRFSMVADICKSAMPTFHLSHPYVNDIISKISNVDVKLEVMKQRMEMQELLEKEQQAMNENEFGEANKQNDALIGIYRGFVGRLKVLAADENMQELCGEEAIAFINGLDDHQTTDFVVRNALQKYFFTLNSPLVQKFENSEMLNFFNVSKQIRRLFEKLSFFKFAFLFFIFFA